VEAVGDAQPRGVPDAAVHHVTAAGHHEADVLGALEDLRGGLDEVLGALLVGDAAEEGDDLLLDAALDHHVLAAAEITALWTVTTLPGSMP
jgi:hypothetical protein